MRIVTLTLLILFGHSLFAQQKILVIDNETNQPVPGVYIELLDAQKQKVDAQITDIDGKTLFNLVGDFTFVASHVSYTTQSGNLSSASYEIKLVPSTTTLNDIVVTGQYHPQSAENSVYSVRSIDNETIQNQGAIKLSDVLSKELNIRLMPDMATGETGISIQGMKGSNVKILVDGIPLVGRNGNGSGADISQINLNTIERVEIVEGPMAVNYGANALGGVINLITKSNSAEKFQLGASVQAETVDDKISSSDGKYTANINGNYWLNDKLSIGTNLGVTRFNGYQGEETGREMQWNPKTQYLGDIKVGYKTKNLNVYYKFDYLYEDIYDAGSVATGQTIAFDEKFITNRFIHQIQANGALYDGNRYSLMFSYSDNNRNKNRFIKDLVTGEKTNAVSTGAQDTTQYQAFVTRGTYSAVEVSTWIDFEVGYDINLEATTGGRLVDESQTIQDYAIYSSAEFKLFNKLKIRPGIRFSYNSKFDSPIVPSINVKYSPSAKIDLRAAYGRGYRAPGLRELYMEFIDATHRVYGNDQLVPETSHHIDGAFVYKTHKQSLTLNSEISAFYNDITNLIDFAYSETDAGYAKYTNIGEFKSIGVNIKERLVWDNLEGGLGFGYVGRYDNPAAEDIPDDYLFSPEVSIDATYREPKSKISFSAYYNFTGKTSRYTFSTDTDGNSTYNLGTIGGYELLDITATRMFGKMLRLTLGGKNLLDVRNVNNSTQSSGGVHSGAGTTPIGYGRSFFIKIDFNLIRQ
jgi:outer membrane receptor for ferrienterochelin and colicins